MPSPDSTHDRADESGSASALRSRSFLGLLITQFLGALNDNMFRWLVVPLAKEQLGDDNAQGAALALSVGLACFVVPYLLFAALAGHLADRYSKRTIIVACKIAEIVLMLCGVAAIAVGNLYLLFAVLFAMGTQSAMFGPSKLGALPEMLPARDLSAANGLMGLTTILATVIGTAAGSFLFVFTAESPALRIVACGVTLVGVAVVGYLASLAVAAAPAAAPTRVFPKNFLRAAFADLAQLARHPGLFRVALGTAFFWAVASLAQLNVDALVVEEFGRSQTQVATALAVLAIGVGAGSVLAGILSGGNVELGLVPLGAAGVALFAMLLNFVSQGYLVWLFLLGASGGAFSVPLAAYMQERSPAATRGTILAAGNFLAFAGMLIVSAVFYVLHGPLGFDATSIFLAAGVATLPVLIYVLVLLPWATARLVVWLLAHTVYRLRIENREAVPQLGGALVVANHVTWLDGLFLMISSSRSLRLVVDASHINGRTLRLLGRVAGVIPVRTPVEEDAAGRGKAIETLRGGGLVCIFAEGNITRTGQLQPFIHDAAAIAEAAGVPIVPAYLDELWGSIFSYEGGRVLWKWPRRWPYQVTIRFGDLLPGTATQDEIRAAVASLAPTIDRAVALDSLTTENTEREHGGT
ncbi:MAG: MFS transporter [Pirellulales bacterium]